MNIRHLFDPSRKINRTIEKVITYGASQENRLKAEISEYVVTDGIEEQFRKLLDKMQLAMEAGGENEIGVWVSGFYGSGKSSFTKYLGLSFDDRITVDGIPFIKHLQDRLRSPQVKAQLATVAQRFPAAVVLLDLASEMLAGATMEDISSVLYYKVLQWAGYSRNLKIAALERRLEKDGRFDEFLKRVEAALPGVSWKEMQNDPLIVDALIPQIAHDIYPALFPSNASFSSSTEGFFKFEDERVKEMIEIVREKSGKQHIIFIIDEVGQYIASRDNLILNLDGLAKNLKRLGDGKVWIISTAQQTLTEDDPRAALNSDKLYKLKDRFPIQVDLESRDIKEICYRRLLSKSPEGATELGRLYDAHGQALRHHTRLQDAKYYDSDFSRETFINLYPFLPAHFDILLHLLGALAKSTGGIGLRSAIKVIQDILVEGAEGTSPVADQSIGWLATTVTLYDALVKDIRHAFPSIHQAVHTTFIRFSDQPLHQEIAKSIAVLQILGNIPVTVQNVASLMHPAVDHPTRLDEVRAAITEMLNEPLVPLGEKDGHLTFLSERLREIEAERGRIVLRSMETKRIFNEALRGAFDPLPKVTLHSTLTVPSGLKYQTGASVVSLAGERETIQIVVKLVGAGDYETERTELLNASRQRHEQNTIFLLSRTAPELEELTNEIYRSQEIVAKYSKEPDQEVKEHCAAQANRAESLRRTQLIPKLKTSLGNGSFIFRGQQTAVASLHQDLLEAAKNLLTDVAGQVFERYAEAPVRVETGAAEKFLRLGNLTGITNTVDPLGLVEVSGGKPRINTSHKAIVSICDYIDRHGTGNGKQILDHFGEAPFGWSPDTTRYLLAAMLVAGEIKLKVSGRDVTATGQQAIDALKTNKSFGAVGIALRDEKPSNETLGRASERLSGLIGETVIPLEQEISKAAAKQFPRYQFEYGSLPEKLSSMSLAGAERARALNQEIADVLMTDASDAPQRLGSEESSLYDNLKWAGDLKQALDNGLGAAIQELQRHCREIDSLPDSGVPGDLRRETREDIEQLRQRFDKDDFHRHAADLNTALTALKSKVAKAVDRMREEQKERIKLGAQELSRTPDWMEFTQEEQNDAIGKIEALALEVQANLDGFKQLLAKDYDINTTIAGLKGSIERQGRDRRLKRMKDDREEGRTRLTKSIPIPAQLTSAAQIEELIRQLTEIRDQLAIYSEIEISITLE